MSEPSTFYEVLKELKIPCAYSHFKDKDSPTKPPYIVYVGNGQDTFGADNTWEYRNNRYQAEYYFTEKDEALETEIEDNFLKHGYNYSKSEDIYIEDEDVFVIYYYL